MNKKNTHKDAGNVAKTREQIAEEFGISTKTLKKWLENVGLELPGGLICPADQERIEKLLGRHPE